MQKKATNRSGFTLMEIMTANSGGTNSFIRALINSELVCPAGGSYILVDVATKLACSLASAGHSL